MVVALTDIEATQIPTVKETINSNKTVFIPDKSNTNFNMKWTDTTYFVV